MDEQARSLSFFAQATPGVELRRILQVLPETEATVVKQVHDALYAESLIPMSVPAPLNQAMHAAIADLEATGKLSIAGLVAVGVLLITSALVAHSAERNPGEEGASPAAALAVVGLAAAKLIELQWLAQIYQIYATKADGGDQPASRQNTAAHAQPADSRQSLQMVPFPNMSRAVNVDDRH